MIAELNNYDWESAFCYASCPEAVPPGSSVSIEGFSEDDVKRIIAMDEGENDGPDWIIAVELNDGRFGFLSAGCDYTGWDCQAGGRSFVAATEADIWQFAISSEEAARLGRKQ